MATQGWTSASAVVIASVFQLGCMAAGHLSPVGDTRCAHDRSQMLELDAQAFDATPQSGWRTIGDVPGCETAAADLIAAYRVSNDAALSARDRRSLYWHEAQLRAGAEDRSQAISLMNQARRPSDRASSVDREDSLYIDASIAFLADDESELHRIRQEYAAIPAPEGFAQAAEQFRANTGETLVWPPNLHVIDGLVACFGRPYRVAYSAECQAQAAH
jgi:hypothetical protein